MLDKSKRVLNFIMPLMLSLIISFCSFSIFADAEGISDTTEFYVSYPEPATGDQNGYLSVVYQNTETGQYLLNTYFWTLYHSPDIDNVMTDGYISMMVVCSSNKVTFTPVIEGYEVEFYQWQLAEYTSQDALNIHRYGLYSVDGNYSYTFNYGQYGRVVGAIYGGNVSYVKGFNGITPVVHWTNSVDALELDRLISRIITELSLTHLSVNDILTKVQDIYNSSLSIENKLDVLQDLYEEMIEEQKETNTWLGKIWDSIQKFFNPDDESKEETDKFEEDTNDQKDKLDDLNEQNQIEKPDADSISDSVDQNINMDDAAAYTGVLAVITNNEYVLQMLLASLSIVVVAYILFGKRD